MAPVPKLKKPKARKRPRVEREGSTLPETKQGKVEKDVK
jgi:hypothetical protein